MYVLWILNWRGALVADHSLFVGDLAPDVTDIILQEYFRQFYPSVRSAKVRPGTFSISHASTNACLSAKSSIAPRPRLDPPPPQVINDAATGRSKGYGFVRFTSEPERNRALAEMSGHFLSNRPIRVSLATARKNPVHAMTVQAPHPSDFDPTNTTLFIGGLSATVTEDQLRAVFSRFGDIIYVKIPQGKGCGFVQFVLRTSAERAMAAMNGQVMSGSALRISWGRSSSRAATQAAQLASLAGLPGGAPGFPGAFGDAALLAATGAYPPQFGGPPSAMMGGDPYAAFGAGVASPEMFGGFVPNLAALQGMMPAPDAGLPPHAAHAAHGPMFPSNTMPGMIPHAATTAAMAAAAAAATTQAVASSGPPSSSGGGQPTSPPNGSDAAAPELSNGASEEVAAVCDALAAVDVKDAPPAAPAANGPANGFVSAPAKPNGALVGAHLFASLLC